MIRVKVTTHSGEDDLLELEEYDPAEVDRKRNDESVVSILIGGNSYSRIDIKNIRIVDENDSDEINEK